MKTRTLLILSLSVCLQAFGGSVSFTGGVMDAGPVKTVTSTSVTPTTHLTNYPEEMATVKDVRSLFAAGTRTFVDYFTFSSVPTGLVPVVANTGVGVVSGNQINKVSAGQTTATWTKRGYSATQALDFRTTTTGLNNLGFDSYVTGSVAANILGNFQTAVAGKNNTNLQIYTSSMGDQLKTDCWMYNWDITCMSPYNETYAIPGTGTAISPRHIVFAAHYPLPINTNLHFTTRDGQTIVRTMTNATNAIGDIRIGVLNADLPSSIKPAKVLPANFSTVYNSDATQLPVFWVDQQRRALIGRMQAVSSSVNGFIIISNFGSQTSSGWKYWSTFSPFNAQVITGDSGNPIFTVINNEPILLTVFWTVTGSYNLGSNQAAVNAAMDALLPSNPYHLQSVDLSGFPAY